MYRCPHGTAVKYLSTTILLLQHSVAKVSCYCNSQIKSLVVWNGYDNVHKRVCCEMFESAYKKLSFALTSECLCED